MTVRISAVVLNMGGQQITAWKIQISCSDAHARRENSIFPVNFKTLPKNQDDLIRICGILNESTTQIC